MASAFASEILAFVERDICVEQPPRWSYPEIHIESDYAFHGMTSKSADQTTFWIPDPQYATQVNYACQTPALLESRPPLGHAAAAWLHVAAPFVVRHRRRPPR